jgi:hypothetical protein
VLTTVNPLAKAEKRFLKILSFAAMSATSAKAIAPTQRLSECWSCNMPLKVATSRINHKAKEDELLLDCTAKSGKGIGKVFAPTWNLLMDSKEGRRTWPEYTEGFYELLRERYASPLHRKAFEEVLNSNKTVVFTCYCNDVYENHHCHRFLLVDIFRKLAESRGITFEYIGEFGKR